MSPDGDDAAAGTSPQGAWKSLGFAGARTYRPGDVLLLEGGETYTGTLAFGEDDGGDPDEPVTVAAHGPGRATIQAAAGPGVSIYNAGGFALRDLDVVGPGGSANATNGVNVYADLPGDRLLPGVTIERVTATGFGRAGVAIGSWSGRTGFRDVLVRDVRAHGNRHAGIVTYAQQRAVHRNVVITRSQADGNLGEPGLDVNSGNGIALGGVDGGRVDHSLAHHNGGRDTAAEGPVGIWTYDSNAVVLEHNESWSNRTSGAADGGGFDFDQNTSGSVAQYNYSHDNDGAGFLSANGPNTAVHRDNVIRYNVSEGDGRKNGHAGIQVWRQAPGLQIHHNTVFLSPTSSESAAARIYDVRGGAGGVALRDNLLVTTGGARLVRMTESDPEAVRFEGNDYWSSGGAFRVTWGTTTHGSLPDWRAATGQERLAGAPVGLAVDPRLVAPGGGGTVGDAGALSSLSAYRLREGSPVVDAGVDLQARFGVAAGARDFHGSPVRPGGRTIGASDIPFAAPLSAPVAAPPAAGRRIRRARRVGLVLRPRCTRACTVRATLALEPRLRRRYGMRPVVARATLRLPRAGRGRLALRVSPAVVRALRRRGRRRVWFVLRTEVRSRSGRVVRTSRRVTLRLT